MERIARLLALTALACASPGLQKFPDRPVAWHEHDDEPVPARPEPHEKYRVTSYLTDDVLGAIDRPLSLPVAASAEDVNALDEVPCSTWYCPRNHIRPVPPAVLAEGRDPADVPVQPFTIVSGKDVGATPGLVAVDARGRRYLLKFDVVGLLGLSTGAEIVGTRLAHAAGWHVPSTYIVEIDPATMRIDPRATYLGREQRERPFREPHLRALLGGVARTPDGLLRAAAVAWLPGEPLGPFEFEGRRADDPNDRIPHERRRSLRASWVFFAWLGVADAGPFNTLDTWVEENGRRFVRHHILDFGAALGSWTTHPKGPNVGQERYVDVGRDALAIVTVGLWQRDWQEERGRWNPGHPAVGWLAAERWDPTSFRTHRRVPAHEEMTDRDAYFGAKVVTSFTDEQLRAVVSAAKYPPEAERVILRALRLRRDAIGREFLVRVAAVETPRVEPDGRVCFTDLAIARRAVRAAQAAYEWRLRDERGAGRAAGRTRPAGAEICVPALASTGPGYRVLELRVRYLGRGAKPARVHLAWRPDERRHVVVGLERDE